jgi:hypothetical protein
MPELAGGVPWTTSPIICRISTLSDTLAYTPPLYRDRKSVRIDSGDRRQPTAREATMPKYLIERALPGVHRLSGEEIHAAANKSCDVLEHLGPDIQWQQSFITEDKITCVYIARDEEIIRKHARLSGFPADSIQPVVAGMDPTTAEPRKTPAAATV